MVVWCFFDVDNVVWVVWLVYCVLGLGIFVVSWGGVIVLRLVCC